MPSLTESPAGIDEAAPTSVSGWTVAVAATFTAEPIGEALRFWLDTLGLAGPVEFAPYNQILQQLLDPSSLLSQNTNGINLVLVRPEDSVRFHPEGWDASAVLAAADEWGDALRVFAERSSTPTVVVVPPPSPRIAADPRRAAVVREAEERLQTAILPFDSLGWITQAEQERYGVADPHDPITDRVGHIPYTPVAMAGLATAIARRIHVLRSSPCKVIALDCDNTLWNGVVGEDGPQGITLGPGMRALQEFVVAQQAEGMIVCLVSKNAEADVLEAFDLRDDFPLRREHLVAWRIGWGSKSQALVQLAEELNLGLDSFIFVDDNPVECAEVRAALPQVLTIAVPDDEGMVGLLQHSWAFDRLKVTEEDRRRTALYRVDADRTRLEARSTDIAAFLASLDLEVTIDPPRAEQLARVAQLTQRTNQFNVSTRRRTEAEVRQFDRADRAVLQVTVRDRFGDYGLVGVLMTAVQGTTLVVETMLLSCRVLGRGVEHAMLAHLGTQALDQGLRTVAVPFRPTAKNEPALRFLRSLPDAVRTVDPGPEGSATYSIAATSAAQLAYRPGTDAREQLDLARTGGKATGAGAVAPLTAGDRSARYARIAGELARPDAVLRAVAAAQRTGRTLATPFVRPGTAIERQLVALWEEVLLLDRVGINDSFPDLGGTSLGAARLFAAIETQFGVRLPMTTLLDAPTVATLAGRISRANRGEARQSLRVLRAGTPGGPSLFLVHDGDGETLLYLNLARRLPAEIAVYGIEPHGTDRCPTTLLTIPAMARFYVDRVREVCPTGPFLLGGMCAGGTIAFEMARKLQDEGQPVGLVALLDAADAQAEVRRHRMTGDRWARFLRAVRGGDEASEAEPAAEPAHSVIRDGAEGTVQRPIDPPLGRLAHRARAVARKVGNLIAYEVGSRLQRRRDEAAIRRLGRLVDLGGDLPTDYVGPSFRTAYKHAERTFHPDGTLDAPVLLIRAGGDGLRHGGDEPLVQLFEAPLLGWAGRVAAGAGGIEVLDVPGGHGGMLQEPHVPAIAAPLGAAIERAVLCEVTR